MRGGALPPALLAAALGFALAFVPRRVIALALGVFAVMAVAAALLSIPKASEGLVFLGCWASVVVTALTVHLPRGLPDRLALLLAANAGVWAGAVIAIAGVPLDLVRALPWAFLALPGAWLAAKGGGTGDQGRRELARRGGDPRGDIAHRTDAGLCWRPSRMSGTTMLRTILMLPLLLLAVPALADVWEVGADGALERLDTPAAAREPVRRAISPSVRAAAYRPAVASAGARYEVSPALIDAIAHVESRYDQTALSRAGAGGIMQLMPATARGLGVDRSDAGENIRGGTAYLRLLLNRFDGDIVRTVAAYNAGPGAVVRAGGIPNYPETVRYVRAVMDRLAEAAR